MTTAPDRAPRSVADLTPDQREQLERAHRRLREAVDAYDRFLGRTIEPNEDVPAHDLDAMARAQAEVEQAEAHLWQLREELLGWVRPARAPAATLVADWFSDEDRVYDDVETQSSS